MKTVYVSFCFLLTALMSSAQLTELAKQCNYEKEDLTLTINGWDFDRTDYDHATFVSVVGAAPLATLSYSGEQDTAEFGYPWFYYADGVSNNIHFKGILEGVNNTYQGKKMINSFTITSRDHFNVNRLRVGDSKAAIIASFSNLCYDSDENHIFLFYKWYTLTFVIDPSTNLVSQISLYSPL